MRRKVEKEESRALNVHKGSPSVFEAHVVLAGAVVVRHAGTPGVREG